MDRDLLRIFDDEEEQEIVPEGFQVKDLQAADWCMTKMTVANTRLSEAKALKNAAIEKINDWFINYSKDYVNTLDMMEGFLRPFVEERIQDTKSKTLKMINGKAGFRTTPEKIEIVNEDELVTFAKKENIPVQVKESVYKKNIKKYIESTGHIPKCINVIPGSEKFYVSTE